MSQEQKNPAAPPQEAGGLEALAGEAQTALQAPVVPADAEQAAEDAAQIAAMEKGMQQVVIGLLKLARAAIARRLPEIREEWTDEVLEAPAVAAIPVFRRYAAKLMEIAGSNPEVAGLVLACLPLGMGLYTAFDRAMVREEAEAKAKKEQASAPA